MIKRVDSGGQVHLVTNIRKPRKWRRYEYLQSSGTQYIDTGVFLISGHILLVELDGNYVNTNSTQEETFGWDYGGLIGRNQAKWTLDAVTASSNISTTIRTTITLTINTVSHTSKCVYKNVNGNTETTQRDNSSIMTYATAGYPLFRAKNKLNLYGSSTAFKLYSCKIYRDGILVRDFVPAQYNGQYGMWDLVEDKFYPNKGTGTFTVGPEMKNYDEIDEVRRTSSLLPAGVELYDYIQSSGTLWIDTQLSSNQMDKFVVNYTATTNNGYILHNGTTQIEIYSTRYGNNSLNTNYTMLGVKNSEQKWTITNLNNNTLYLNNWTGYDHSEPDYLFALSPGAAGNAAGLKIYYYKTYLNGVLLRNFLPCTYLGEPGMWDTVENKFYRNQGTGQFTLGNKITLKEYEYLLNDANSYLDTEYIPNTNTHIKTKVQFSTIGDGKFFVYGGADTAYNNKAFELYDWGSKLLFNYGNLANIELVPIINAWLEIEHNRNQVNCNGLSKTIIANTFTSPKTMCLYAINRTSGVYKSPNAHKIQYFKIWDNDILVRDFIPVSYNRTPGLWDKVEWKFYGNAGSGNFTLGPEKASGVYPVSYLYDRNVYEEPDGSKWLRIVHHNNPSTRRFTSSDSFSTYIHTSNDLFFDASWCNTFTLWELMVKQKATSGATEQKFRWVLNYNPMTATFANVAKANVTYNTSSGYTVPGGNWGGLMKINNDNTYLCGNNGTNGNWWGAIGCKVLYSGGLPGWNLLTVTTGYIDLYIRVA